MSNKKGSLSSESRSRKNGHNRAHTLTLNQESIDSGPGFYYEKADDHSSASFQKAESSIDKSVDRSVQMKVTNERLAKLEMMYQELSALESKVKKNWNDLIVNQMKQIEVCAYVSMGS